MNTITRAQLVGALQRAAGHRRRRRRLEGGSAAFEGDDGLSDVDAVVVVADDAVESTFAQVEAALQALSPVTLRLDVPGTAGYAQKFNRLRDAGEFLVVDLVLLRRSDPLLFREVELHGRGRTWFDRRGILHVQAHLDAALDMEQARARAGAGRELCLVPAHRDQGAHAWARRRRAGVLSIHDLAPAGGGAAPVARPQRRVFGPRYLTRDLPAPVCQRVEALACVRDLADLAGKHEQARRWFDECIARL